MKRLLSWFVLLLLTVHVSSDVCREGIVTKLIGGGGLTITAQTKTLDVEVKTDNALDSIQFYVNFDDAKDVKCNSQTGSFEIEGCKITYKFDKTFAFKLDGDSKDTFTFEYEENSPHSGVVIVDKGGILIRGPNDVKSTKKVTNKCYSDSIKQDKKFSLKNIIAPADDCVVQLEFKAGFDVTTGKVDGKDCEFDAAETGGPISPEPTTSENPGTDTTTSGTPDTGPTTTTDPNAPTDSTPGTTTTTSGPDNTPTSGTPYTGPTTTADPNAPTSTAPGPVTTAGGAPETTTSDPGSSKWIWIGVGIALLIIVIIIIAIVVFFCWRKSKAKASEEDTEAGDAGAEGTQSDAPAEGGAADGPEAENTQKDSVKKDSDKKDSDNTQSEGADNTQNE